MGGYHYSCSSCNGHRLWSGMTDDPHDDSTNWAGNLPKTSDNSPKRTTKRDTGRAEQPDVQRQESRLATQKETKPSIPD